MSNIIKKSIAEPLTKNHSTWKEKWEGNDLGLIACWEQGRVLAQSDSLLSEKAKNNELPVLPWKGGYSKKILKGKYAPFYYLAMLQGLKGIDLNIELQEEVELICSHTEMTTIFTNDKSLYSND